MYPQKKEISQAKAWIKEGKELNKAEESMRNLLKDSVNRKNKKIWLVLYDAIKKQYDQGNEQLYLKNNMILLFCSMPHAECFSFLRVSIR